VARTGDEPWFAVPEALVGSIDFEHDCMGSRGASYFSWLNPDKSGPGRVIKSTSPFRSTKGLS
jgi:hypothetical protein